MQHVQNGENPTLCISVLGIGESFVAEAQNGDTYLFEMSAIGRQATVVKYKQETGQRRELRRWERVSLPSVLAVGKNRLITSRGKQEFMTWTLKRVQRLTT